MATDKIECYVINTTIYKNNSLIIQVLTKYGIKTIFGKGFKKIKSKSTVFENRYINLEVLGSINGDVLNCVDFKVINYNEDIILNFNYNLFLDTISNLMLNFREFDYFELFKLTLNNIEENNLHNFYFIWLSNLYNQLQEEVNTESCTYCNCNINIVDFDFYMHGFVCNNCKVYDNDLSLNELKIMRLILNQRYDKLLEIKATKKLMKLMYDSISETQGIKLKLMEKYVTNL